MISKAPDEVCEECKKTLSRKVIANIFNDRVVCTACYRKLKREFDAANYVPPLASEAQKSYAKHLGISFPEGIGMLEMSGLISAAMGEGDDEPAPREDEAKLVLEWVYSVLRHMTKSNGWIIHSDCPIPESEMARVAAVIKSDEQMVEAICEQDKGDQSVEFMQEGDRQVIDECYWADWFFFTADGANSRTNAYKQTKDKILELLKDHITTRVVD